MKWAQTFKPIVLNDGRSIASLEDGRELMSSISVSNLDSFHWRYAGELLLKAADRGERYAVMDARAQLERALRADSLVDERICDSRSRTGRRIRPRRQAAGGIERR
jgi:hypothetical protein